MTINIIYTPDTVKHLWLLTLSILKNCDNNIRIIANGCSDKEVEFLTTQCIYETRFEFCQISNSITLPHHSILNQIYDYDKDEKHFCFIDSDILATSNFIDSFLPFLKNNAGVFSCTPFWSSSNKIESLNRNLHGRYFYTKNNLTVGGSYFAIYNRSDLDEIFQNEEIKFDRFTKEELSKRHLAILTELDEIYDYYDTAKVLNLLLLYYNKNLLVLQNENLIHLGGHSACHIKIHPNQISPLNLSFIKLLEDNPENIKRRIIGHYFDNYFDALYNNVKQKEYSAISNSIHYKTILQFKKEVNKLYSQYKSIYEQANF